MLKKVFNFMLRHLLDVNWLKAKLNQTIIDELYKHVTIGKNSRFYEQAKISNLQSDISKINIGERTHIRGYLLIFAYGGNINIGINSYVGENSYIWSGENIQIGDNVLISHNVNIIDSNSHEMDSIDRALGYRNLIEIGHPKEKGSILTSPIVIKDYAWINFNSVILKGVTIGKGAVVGAGTVVTKDVPDYAFVAGNPAKIIKYLK
jgi:acetyltransferase-like isoleucine patch superfamily enzyme